MNKSSAVFTFTSIANVNDSNELEGRRTMRPTAGSSDVLCLKSLLLAKLDETQRATYQSLNVNPCPPSGVGSDRITMRA